MTSHVTIVAVGNDISSVDMSPPDRPNSAIFEYFNPRSDADDTLNAAIQQLEAAGHKIVSIAPMTSGQTYNRSGWCTGVSYTDRFMVHSTQAS